VSQTKLIETVRDCNREITPADRHGLLKLIEQQAARIAELEKQLQFESARGDYHASAGDETHDALVDAHKRIAELEARERTMSRLLCRNGEGLCVMDSGLELRLAAPVASGPRYDWSVSGMKQSETGNWVMAGDAADSAMAKDAERLDWLDRMNAALNRHYGTTYQWKVILSPNITRLMTGRQWAGFVGDIDLNDAQCGNGSFANVREAIDAAIAASAEKGDKA
jgi:hypothetical protein